MRIQLLVLVALCVAAAYSAAVPVQVAQAPSEQAAEPATAEPPGSTTAKPEARKGRQQAAAEEDDDDDDDDDDLDLDVVDDDDDDDDDSPAAAEDDDDDDDYFGGLFDDILGDDDDDDDEEDETPAASQPVVSPAEAILPEEAVAEEEYDSATDTALAEGADSDLVEKDPATAAAEIELPPNAIIVQPVPAEEEEEEDDDDDDDEDELDELTGDDDDDDDDDDVAADDDDDDDDEDELEALADADDVIEARRSRGLELERDRTAAIYVSKYNRFIDNIIGRVNRILRRSYDPVRVKLNNSATKKNKAKRKSSPRPQKPAPTSNKSSGPDRIRSTHKSASTQKSAQSRRPIKPGNTENNSVKVSETPRAAAPQKKPQPQRKRVKNNKKKGSGKAAQKARATLYGLSTIKREGDVSVNMMADHTTVKTNFAVGPLTLRVEKEFGRGQKREIKSATATTAEMHGKLSLRVTNSGTASLHSIKVLQPKQVRVESPDEHDRTREFVWKRSSHIAHLVSQKLAAATRSMLKPSAKAFPSSTPAATTTTSPTSPKP